MEMQANKSRREVEFNSGDMVLVELQPYRQVKLAKRHTNKLAKRYYWPFKVLERVGKVAYQLALPDLRATRRATLAIFATQMVLQNGVPARQVLVMERNITVGSDMGMVVRVQVCLSILPL
ncbi:hypothetical protein Tco_0689176 [Tanacetum coccineum]